MSDTAYDAFISYSRNDQQAAERVQAALRSFARPWYQRRSFRVFRDTSDLAAEPSLWDAVARALDRSRHLIVLASPSTARSPWVERELRYWLAAHPPESMSLVRVDGTIRWSAEGQDFDWETSNAIPAALKGVFASEPLYVDLGASQTLSLRDPAFRRAVAQLAARMRNVELDEILGEDLRRHRQTQLVIGAVALVVLALAGVGALAYRRSILEGRVALSRRLAAQSREALSQRDARLALLLGLTALRHGDTREAYGALLEGLVATRRLATDIQVSDVGVDAVAIALDRRLLLTGDARGTVAFWNLPDGVEQARHVGVHPGGVTDIVISPEGRLGASGGFDGGFVVWDLDRRLPIHAVRSGPGFSLAFTPDGQWLLLGGRHGDVSAWDVTQRRPVRTRTHPEDGTIADVAVENTGSRFVTGGLFGIVRVWDRPTLRSLRTIDPQPSTGTSVDISTDGRSLVFAGASAAGRWDFTDYELAAEPYISATHAVHYARSTGGALAPVALAIGAELDLWQDELHRIGFHREEIHSLEVDRARTLLVTGSVDGRARTWSLRPHNSFVSTFLVPDSSQRPHAVAFSKDGARIAVGAAHVRLSSLGRRTSTRGTIYVIRAATGEQIAEPLEGHRGTILSLAFSPDGLLASASDDGTVRVWDIERRTSRIIGAGGDRTSAADVAFSSDGRLLAVARGNDGAQVWDVERNVLSWRSKAGDVLAVAFSHGGQELALGTATGEVRLWPTAGGTERTFLAPSTTDRPVGQLAFSLDGRRLVAVLGGEPRVLDIANGTTTSASTLGDSRSVRSVGIGAAVAALLERNDRLSLWDLRSQGKIAELNRGLEAYFYPAPGQVAISEDGMRLAATLDGQVVMFSIGRSALEDRACAVAEVPLSRAEWARFVQTATYVRLCPSHPQNVSDGFERIIR